MTNEEYFFYEWLIIEKGMTDESFNRITQQEFNDLKAEYVKFQKGLR